KNTFSPRRTRRFRRGRDGTAAAQTPSRPLRIHRVLCGKAFSFLRRKIDAVLLADRQARSRTAHGVGLRLDRGRGRAGRDRQPRRARRRPRGLHALRQHSRDAPALGARIVDAEAWEKVTAGVYKGFSIGGHVTGRDPADRKVITGLALTEISIVDRPANPEAVFDCWKRAPAADLAGRTISAEPDEPI